MSEKTIINFLSVFYFYKKCTDPLYVLSTRSLIHFYKNITMMYKKRTHDKSSKNVLNVLIKKTITNFN